VICGAAGTGKTTSFVHLQAIDKAHGQEATFLLLAPTGKAADRIREKTDKDASTIHSFLRRRGWLNENLTIKLQAARKEELVTHTSSMRHRCSISKCSRIVPRHRAERHSATNYRGRSKPAPTDRRVRFSRTSSVGSGQITPTAWAN